MSNGTDAVELTRVQPFEAQVILAKLLASGIDASLGADSPYDSLTYADGVSVFVAAEDATQAKGVLEDAEPD